MPEANETAKELLAEIVKAFVDEPDKVAVEFKTGILLDSKVPGEGVLFSVKVADKDAGLVIGKEGKTLAAIRTILGVIGRQKKARYDIVLDVPKRERERSPEPPKH